MSEVLVGDESEDKPTSAEVQKQEKIEPNRKQYKTPIKTQQLVVEDNKFEINN
jgi:hypothetical protein